MDVDIWVAIIGVLEVAVGAILPVIFSKRSKKKAEVMADEKAQLIAEAKAQILAEEKAQLIAEEITKKKVLPQYVKPISNSSIQSDIDGIFEQMLLPFTTEMETSVYLRLYQADIEIFVDESNTKVASDYTITFVNPYREQYTFKRKPRLKKGVEFETYAWHKITYQGKSANNCIREYMPHEQQTPNEHYLHKSGLELTLTTLHDESTLHYGAEYYQESTSVFVAYWFWHYCKNMSINIRLTGPDADKYEIGYSFFASSNKKRVNAERNMHHNEPKHVSSSYSGWIFPGDGYVITINKIK